jgi:CRP-like cAMP-binding protein
MSSSPQSSRSRNLLLASLSDREYLRFKAELERLDVPLGESVIREWDESEWAFFPEEAVLSIVNVLGDGSMIEVGVIGYDGMVGINSLAEGVPYQPYRVIVQNPGTLLRMPMIRLREEFRRGGELQRLLLQFSTRFLIQVSQTAACNRLHTIERRLAKWLLMMRDRTTSNQLKLTQEFLSHMLGARIAGVNEALRSLTLSGLVTHGRANIEIIDRDGLELSACECYALLRKLTPQSQMDA